MSPAAAGPRSVVVVGGGIAGLAAAWFATGGAAAAPGGWAQAGPAPGGSASGGPAAWRVLVLEGAARLGGKLHGGEIAGVPVDLGAEALLARRPEATDLLAAVGLAGACREPGTTSARLWVRGRLRPIPAGTLLGVPGRIRPLVRSGVLPPGRVLPALAGLARRRPVLAGDVAVGAYLAGPLVRPVVDHLVEPLLGGVYAGDAAQLSLAATVPALYAAAARQPASVLEAVAAARAAAPPATGPVFAGVDGGIARLVGALAEQLQARGVRLRTGAMVRELHRAPAGWRLVVGSAHAPEEVIADAVVLACPPPAAARLLQDAAPVAAAELAEIPMASVAIATFAFGRNDVAARLPGSGFLVPPVERRFVKAATFSSAKWPWLADRAPGLAIVRASVGRFGAAADLQHDDADILGRVLADLRAALGPLPDPVDRTLTRWGGALPQYLVGHLDRVARARSAVAALPGLALAGAGYGGVGVPACIASGRAAVTQVEATLPARGQ